MFTNPWEPVAPFESGGAGPTQHREYLACHPEPDDKRLKTVHLHVDNRDRDTAFDARRGQSAPFDFVVRFDPIHDVVTAEVKVFACPKPVGESYVSLDVAQLGDQLVSTDGYSHQRFAVAYFDPARVGRRKQADQGGPAVRQKRGVRPSDSVAHPPRRQGRHPRGCGPDGRSRFVTAREPAAGPHLPSVAGPLWVVVGYSKGPARYYCTDCAGRNSDRRSLNFSFRVVRAGDRDCVAVGDGQHREGSGHETCADYAADGNAADGSGRCRRAAAGRAHGKHVPVLLAVATRGHQPSTGRVCMRLGRQHIVTDQSRRCSSRCPRTHG